VVWALVLVCVAGIAIMVMRSRRPEPEPAPIVAVPVPTPKKTPVGPQLRAKAPTTPPPSGDTATKRAPTAPPSSGAAPMAAALMIDSEPIVVRSSAPRQPESIPLEDPLAGIDLGAAGGRSEHRGAIEPPRSKYAATEMEYDPASTPEIQLAEQPRTKVPTAQPLATAQPIAMARTRSATIPPVVRAKAPSVAPLEAPRTKAPSIAPVDAPRPKTPSATPIATIDDIPSVEEIPVSPESGLRIRAKRPSSAPPIATEPKKGTPAKGVVVRKPPTLPPDPTRKGTPAHGVALRSKTPGAVQQISPLDPPPVVIPDGLANKLAYTTMTANISHVGIDAKREDGFTRVVMWPDVVGIVARRLPADAPFAGATFIDLVSTAGATLRILPWTQLTGDAVAGDGAERARAFCQLVAARCRGAKLDPATRTFIGSHGQAAQLPDEETLAAHDKRLA
jgi:hypothetical protein